MIDLEKLQDMWREDCKIDDIMLDESSIKIPQLHSKYLDHHNNFSLLLRKAKQEEKVATHKKWLYYSGKEVPEDSEPFQYKVIKSDVDNWIGVDEQILKIRKKIEYYEVCLNFLEEVLRQVNNMNYIISNIVKWRTFTHGS